MRHVLELKKNLISVGQLDESVPFHKFYGSYMEGVRGLGAGRANEGTLPRIRQRWTAAETNSAGSMQGSVQVFELATWHGRGA